MKITIFGAGKLGTSLAQALLVAEHDITVIEKSPELVDRLSSRMDLQSVCANAKDIAGLKELGVDKSDVVIACTDTDEKNMVLCALAKELGVKRCIARIRSYEYAENLGFIRRAMHIDYLVNPDNACAIEVYKHLSGKNSSRDVQMINGLALIDFEADSLDGFVGGVMKDKSKLLDGLLAAAISRNGNIIIPSGNTEILSGDRVYAIGDNATALHLRTKLRDETNAGERINRVMIAGGGKTAYFLSKLLINDGIKVKIIENDFERGKHLAVILDKASVVYGDATDQDLLFEEELDQMDAFISCTGFDEENVLLALMANKRGVKNVVAKMSRRSYGPIMENLGDTMVINPIELCTANVLRFINEDRNLKFSKLIQGQAEFTEITVDGSMPVAGKRIANLELPEGILIGAIHRNGEIIVPNGSTAIYIGDRLIILSLLSKVPELGKLIKQTSSGEF